jgi:DNA-binding PucR family transcriptional regulator
VSGALTFRDAYLDAARTARALAALGRRTGIARSDDLGVFGILLSHTGPRELAGQLRRELGPLLAEERRRGVPLVATLTAYLENGQRPSATAPALGVHVNTLYQRLAVIDRVLGPTWRERALELQVLLRVRAAADGLD